MPYSHRIFENLPIFARMVDEERGLLRHLCDWGIQPELDEIYTKIQQQEYFYNPDHPASWGHLDWLGQFVGLGIIDGHWLGVGLKPSWSIATKINAIKRAWRYWQIKGSEPGIREAIAIWLQFEDKRRLLLNLPFGRTPTDEPPNWHGWGTSYDVSLNQTFPEKQRLGWGNYWGHHYQPDYFTLQADWNWEWGELMPSGGDGDAGEPWQDRDGEIPLLNYVEPPDIHMDRSRMGDRELWMHFYLKEGEWNRIFPDIFELNLESVPITTTTSVFGWLQGIRQPAIQPLVQAPSSTEAQTVTEIEFDGMQWGQLIGTDSWELADDAWGYAGTLWPFETTDPYTTSKTVESTIEWGVWEPDWWDGQWWGTIIDREARHESVSISIAELAPVATLTGETLTINTQDLSYYTEVAPTCWYAAWEERVITEIITEQHPGTGCLEGIPVKFDSSPNTLSISLGRSLAETTNQLFAPYEVEGEPQFIPSQGLQQTLSISLPRNNADDFIDASVELPQANAPSAWLDAVFLDSGGVPETGFAPGYVEQSVQVEGFEPGNIEGFEPGWIQTNYPLITGFVEANLEFDEFEEHHTLTGETLIMESSQPEGWLVPVKRIQMELAEPIGIATYGGEYEEYSYYYDSGYTGVISDAAVPMQTLSINTSEWEPMETLSATPEVDGYLCNVFAGWSTLTPTKINQYKREIPEEDSSIFDAYPLLAQANDGESWKLLVETEEEFYILRPVTMFWKERGRQIPIGKEVKRSQIFSFEEGMTDLYLEFLFQPIDTYLHSASLSLAGKLIQHQNYYYKLNAPGEAYIGFVFDVPFRLPSGAGSPQEEVLLEEILPNLTQELLQLAGLPTTSGLVPAPVITTLPTEPAVPPESLKDILRSLRDLIRDKAGDKHFPYTIESPSTEVQIEHNLGKHPSVTFVDTVDGEGNKSYGDVRYIDRNTVVISFSEPTVGRVFCN